MQSAPIRCLTGVPQVEAVTQGEFDTLVELEQQMIVDAEESRFESEHRKHEKAVESEEAGELESRLIKLEAQLEYMQKLFRAAVDALMEAYEIGLLPLPTDAERVAAEVALANGEVNSLQPHYNPTTVRLTL